MAVRKLSLIAVAAVSALAVSLGAGATVAQAASFEGVVVAKNKDARTFSIKQDEGGGTVKLKVNAATKFQRIAGFGAIKVGARNIEATARKNANGRWIATTVETRGGGGGGADDGGGGGGGGNDDGPNHT